MYIGKVLKPFLVKYQADAPIMMFLGEGLQDTCQKLMQKFVKMSILDSEATTYKVAYLDVLDTKNHRSASDIDVGFSTKAIITNLVQKKAVSEREVHEFKMECVKFLSNLAHKILERKSPEVQTYQKSLLPKSQDD